jgi:hypothetical protein
VVARVVADTNVEDIAALTVARIAERRGVTPEAALEDASYDALLAAAARDRLDSRSVHASESRILAQAMLRQLWLELRDAPVTDAELAEATEVRWTRWDRPLGRRTIHFVVEATDADDTGKHARARALAEKLREAIVAVANRAEHEPAPVRNDDEMFTIGTGPKDIIEEPFLEAVKAVDAGGLSVIAQVLHPITADGRPIDHEQPLAVTYYDAEFARQTAALDERGAITPVFRSYAGYHAAVLLDITPERRASRRERIDALRDAIVMVRAKRAKRVLLERLRLGTEVPPNSNALLSLIGAVPDANVEGP